MRLKWLAVAIAAILIVVAAGAVIIARQDNKQPVGQSGNASGLDGPKVTLRTDNTEITARPYLVKNAKTGIVIVHDLGKDRSSTMQFAEDLAKSGGFSTMAVDLRGYGQSRGDKDNYQAMQQDVAAAGEYLKLNGVQEVSYIGFGFGAQLALQAAVSQGSKAVILVSPSTDNRDINTDEQAKSYSGRFMVVASEDDSASNAMASRLFNLCQSKNKQYPEYKKGGNGTELIYNTDLGKIILDWLKVTYAT